MYGALNRDTHLYPPHKKSSVHLTTTYVRRSGRITIGMRSGWTTPQGSAFSSPTPSPIPLEWPSQEAPGSGLTASTPVSGVSAPVCTNGVWPPLRPVSVAQKSKPPHGLHGLTFLDDETIEWLLNTCPEIECGQAVVTTTGSKEGRKFIFATGVMSIRIICRTENYGTIRRMFTFKRIAKKNGKSPPLAKGHKINFIAINYTKWPKRTTNTLWGRNVKILNELLRKKTWYQALLCYCCRKRDIQLKNIYEASCKFETVQQLCLIYCMWWQYLIKVVMYQDFNCVSILLCLFSKGNFVELTTVRRLLFLDTNFWWEVAMSKINKRRKMQRMQGNVIYAPIRSWDEIGWIVVYRKRSINSVKHVKSSINYSNKNSLILQTNFAPLFDFTSYTFWPFLFCMRGHCFGIWFE